LLNKKAEWNQTIEPFYRKIGKERNYSIIRNANKDKEERMDLIR
jgi:hypothetical protein